MSPAECSATKVSSPHPISSPQQAVTTHECPTTRATLQPIIMVGLLHGGNDSPYAPNSITKYRKFVLYNPPHSTPNTSGAKCDGKYKTNSTFTHLPYYQSSQSRWQFGHGLRQRPRDVPPPISPHKQSRRIPYAPNCIIKHRKSVLYSPYHSTPNTSGAKCYRMYRTN